MLDNTLPYSEHISEHYSIRNFSANTDAFEYVWHRDKEDRYIQATQKTDWKFQLDNQLPSRLTENKLFIPKETYHRLIKGTGDLEVRIFKL